MDAVHGCPPADGVPPFLVPGEREALVADERASSIPLDEKTAALLGRHAAELGIPLPSGE